MLGAITTLNTTSKEFGQQQEGSLNKEISGIVGGAANSEEAIQKLNDALLTTEIKLQKTRSALKENDSIFNFLDPAALATEKGLEASVGTFEKRLKY